jgi:hypothetical protein
VLLPSKFFQVLPNGSPDGDQMLKTYKKLKQNINKCFVKLNKIKIKKGILKLYLQNSVQRKTKGISTKKNKRNVSKRFVIKKKKQNKEF